MSGTGLHRLNRRGPDQLMPSPSAGLLPFRFRSDKALEVLLVHPGGPYWRGREQQAWSVAKGEYLADETPLHAAEREFAEELGLSVPLGERLDLGEVHQAGGKRVHVWAIETDDLPLDDMVSNRFEMEWPPRSGRLQSFPEVDRAEWTSLDLARERLVAAQVEFLDRLIGMVGR
jgi:predicted NUDIX family NTP pyrophosphohydrolase